MSLNAYDVKIFVWKVIKVSTTTCLNVSRKHPYVTSCLLFLFILYLCCPLFFWIFIYSLPLAVSTWVVLNIPDSRRCKEEREIEREQKERESGRKLGKEMQFVASDSNNHGEEEKGKRMKKGFSRVHSVRRRRAKEITREDDSAESKSHTANQYTIEEKAEEEKKTILMMDTVDKTTLVEKSPKEIREVEANNLLTNVDPGADVSIDHELYQNSDLVKSLKLLKDEEDARDEASKSMDVNLAETEKNERLESLIAKRRSHKTIGLQIQKPPVNTDAATTGPQMTPIVIPKINTWTSPSKNMGPHSPGSAPSVLVPNRNPFDLPYDPQEEKPDLTGDSFQQEFALGHNRDFVFCRHESFSLGHSLPMDFFEDHDDASSIDDFGFRRRRSSIGYRYPKPQYEESDLSATTGAESGQESDSKSNVGSPNSSDEIKEVIQVHENGGQSNDSVEGSIRPTESNTRHNPLDELSLSSNSSRSSMGSSEDERPPICKINREAILKSLSMRRNSVSVLDIEMESNNHQLQENNLSYANSALENASRFKQQYFADKPLKRHAMTFSIASDMQVEVSEISSPPLTIGESMSYQDDTSAYDTEMERNASWDGLDSWAGSSRMSETEDNEMRPTRPIEVGATRRKYMTMSSYGDEEKHCITSSSSASESQATQSASPESNNGEELPVLEDAKSSEETIVENNASTNQATMDSNGLTQEGSTERVHHATISPKSVLQPTLSVASFDHEGDDEVQQSGAYPIDRPSLNVPQNSASTVLHFTVDGASQELPSEPPNASDEQQKIRKNDKKLKGVADGSSSAMVEIHEKPTQTRDESSSSSSSSTSNGVDSVNDKQKIEGNDGHSKEVSGDGSSEVAEKKSSSRSVLSLPSAKKMGNEETIHNDSSKISSSDGQIGKKDDYEEGQ